MKISTLGSTVSFTLGGLTILGFFFGQLVGLICGALLLTSLLIFRSSKHEMVCCNSDMVSPIGGRVVAYTKEYFDQKWKRQWQKLDIERNVLGPWVFHAPIEGRVKELWVQSGRVSNKLELVFQMRSSSQEDLLLILTANSFFNYLDDSNLQPGAILGKGRDLGFCTIRRVSVCVPVKWIPRAKVGEKLTPRVSVLFGVT